MTSSCLKGGGEGAFVIVGERVQLGGACAPSIRLRCFAATPRQARLRFSATPRQATLVCARACFACGVSMRAARACRPDRAPRHRRACEGTPLRTRSRVLRGGEVVERDEAGGGAVHHLRL